MARHTRKSRHKVQTHQASKADTLLALSPNDVLINIFLSLRALYEQDFQGRKKLGWIVASHVSQRWRNVALGCGNLWGHIHSADPAVAEWLKRAGDTPLSVKVQIQVPSDEGVLIMVLKRLSQIETLAIDIMSSISATTYHRIWYHLRVIYSTPAPLLSLFEMDDDIGGQNPHLPLFNGNAPKFRRYSSRGFMPMLPSTSLNNLTAFVISSPSEPLNKFLLLRQLGNMPNLELFLLENALVPMEQTLDTLPNFPISRLPSLKNFICQGTYFNTDLDFFAHLSLPRKTALMFSSTLGSTDLSAFPRLIDAYNQVRAPHPVIRLLRLGWGGQLFQLVTSKTFTPSTPDDYTPEVVIRLNGPWEDDDVLPTSWAEDLVRLPLSELEYFHLDCEIGSLAWSLLSKECRELLYLSLQGPATTEFLYLIVKDYKDHCPLFGYSEDQHEEMIKGLSHKEISALVAEKYAWKDPIFYSLQTIEIVGLNLDGARPMIVLLQMALRDRRHFCDLFVEEVVIKECGNVTSWMIEKLTKVVKVRWDDVLYPWTNETDEDWLVEYNEEDVKKLYQ